MNKKKPSVLQIKSAICLEFKAILSICFGPIFICKIKDINEYIGLSLFAHLFSHNDVCVLASVMATFV